MNFHPIADVFPMMDPGAFDELAEVIKLNGLLTPIVTYEDKILDGRNREKACEKVGVEPRYVPYAGSTPLSYVINDRAAANHYATSRLDKIKERDVPSISADDCVLALWATVPMLEQALDVMRHWGFSYKSHCIWLKDKPGTGFWFRNVHELLLIGTRGAPPAPAPGTQFESAWDAPVGEHSEKPELTYELLETNYPNLPKIELNARKQRPGWEVWGAEARSIWRLIARPGRSIALMATAAPTPATR